jgi:hypothetical protein
MELVISFFSFFFPLWVYYDYDVRWGDVVWFVLLLCPVHVLRCNILYTWVVLCGDARAVLHVGKGIMGGEGG